MRAMRVRFILWRLRNRVKSIPIPVRKKLAVIAIVFLCLLAWLIYNQFDKRKWNRFIAKLDAQPGIVVTGSDRNRKNYIVRGLKDPLAADVATLLTGSGLNRDRVIFQLEPYKAMHSQFSIKRIRSVIVPPTGVDLSLDGSVLHISGAKSNSWMEDVKRLVRQFPEVSHVTFGPVTQ